MHELRTAGDSHAHAHAHARVRARLQPYYSALALALVPALTLASCGPDAPAAAKPSAATQYVVVVDLSASQTGARLDNARTLLTDVVDNLDYGDGLVLLGMRQQGVLEQNDQRWATDVPELPHAEPTSMDQSKLESARKGAHAVADVFFDENTAGKAAHTDIFATLHLAAAEIRAADGRTPVLVLLSDMLQSAQGVEMEQLRAMPDANWLEQERQAGRLPNLRGACVVVVGADYTTPHGSAVRDFWQEYFRTTGAVLMPQNYQITSASAQSLGCG